MDPLLQDVHRVSGENVDARENPELVKQALVRGKRMYRLFIWIDTLFAILVLIHIYGNVSREAVSAMDLVVSKCLATMLLIDVILAFSMYHAMPTAPPTAKHCCCCCPPLFCLVALSNLLMNAMTTGCWCTLKLLSLGGLSPLACLLLFVVAIARFVKLIPMLRMWESLRDYSDGDATKLQEFKVNRFDDALGMLAEVMMKALIVMIVGLFILLTVYLWSNGAGWGDVIDQTFTSQPDVPDGLVELDATTSVDQPSVQPLLLVANGCEDTSWRGFYGKFCCDPTCASNVRVESSDARQAARAVGLGVSGGATGGVASFGAVAGAMAAAGAEGAVFAGGIGAGIGTVGGLITALVAAYDTRYSKCVQQEAADTLEPSMFCS